MPVHAPERPLGRDPLSSGKRCAHSSTYGKQCIAVTGSGRRWRIDLER